MSVLLNDTPTTAHLYRDFSDADGLAELEARDWVDERGSVVVEIQPLTLLGQHALICIGCPSCWSPEIQTEESWRGI